METVKNWTFSVCCASIFCGILNLLLPEGSTKKIFKSVIYVFFLSVVISTFSGFDFSDFLNFSELKKEETNYENNEFSNISENILKDEIIKATGEVLDSEGIYAEKIFLEVNISAEGSIDIIDFAVTVPEAAYSEELSEKIHQKTGIEPEIIISGEN